jgi:hypothetical protein
VILYEAMVVIIFIPLVSVIILARLEKRYREE